MNEEETEYDIHKTGSGRQFENDFLEKFSKGHYLVPLVVYAPLVAWCLWNSRDLGVGTALALVLAGVFIWTLAEYWLHRLVFHWDKNEKVHYFLHGIHHVYPNDRTRLVMPVGASAVPAGIFYIVARVALGPEVCIPAFAGFAIGYLWYDMTHAWTHIGKPKNKWGRLLRRWHMMHHFKDHDTKYGVTTPFWDHVFGTTGE